MKKSIFLLSLFSILILNLSAQTIMESDKVMSKGLNSAATLELSDVSEKQVETWWKEYMRSYTKKMKKDRKSKEWFADDVNIAEISSATPVDLYTKVESAGKYTVVSTWVESGEGYVSSSATPEAYGGLETLLMGFDHFVGVEKVNIELAEEEKSLKKLENELKKLKSQKDGYHKEIENAEAKIARAEENIEKNEELQDAQQKSIEEQMNVVEQVRVKLNDMQKQKIKE